ncbi:ABC transporter permease family protein [Dactylosporangium cerinum]
MPVFGTYTELNKAFTTGGLVNQNILSLAHATPRPVQISWRCDPARCPDTFGLIRTAAQVVGGRPQDAQRVDNVGQILPILTAQRRDGQRFAAIVVLLGMLAVAFVATAFIEVRAPQFATLRALGASRSAIGAIALLENLFTAATVAVLAAGLGLAAGFLNPDLFNQIPQVRLDRMQVPVALYAQTVALTLFIGLLTGLAPALRAYRSVRTT